MTHSLSHSPLSRRGLVRAGVALALALTTCAVVMLIAPPNAHAAIRTCGAVSFEYPNGGGGAYGGSILARNIGCHNARQVVKACMRGHRAAGWRGYTLGEFIVLTASNNRRIRYRPAGGGGCL